MLQFTTNFFNDALVATIYPFMIYSYTIFPAPTKTNNVAHNQQFNWKQEK